MKDITQTLGWVWYGVKVKPTTENGLEASFTWWFGVVVRVLLVVRYADEQDERVAGEQAANGSG